MRRLAISWPVWVGLAAALVGVAMAGAAWQLQRRAQALLEAPQAPARAEAPAGELGVDAALQALPAESAYLGDLQRTFQLARDGGIAIGAVEYRTEPQGAVPVLVHRLVFRVDVDYARLKAFVAGVLRSMPHASLQEIRVERRNAAEPQAKAQRASRSCTAWRPRARHPRAKASLRRPRR